MARRNPLGQCVGIVHGRGHPQALRRRTNRPVVRAPSACRCGTLAHSGVAAVVGSGDVCVGALSGSKVIEVC